MLMNGMRRWVQTFAAPLYCLEGTLFLLNLEYWKGILA